MGFREKTRLNYGKRFGDKDAFCEETYFDFLLEKSGDKEGVFPLNAKWEDVPDVIRKSVQKHFDELVQEEQSLS